MQIQEDSYTSQKRRQLIHQYLFKAIKLSQFKNIRKKLNQLQYCPQSPSVYLQQNLMCLYNRYQTGQFFCSNKKCKNHPIICGSQKCSCHQQHLNCKRILAQPFLQVIYQKINQPLSQDLSQYFQAKYYVYEFMTNRISQQRIIFLQWHDHFKTSKKRKPLYLYGFDQLGRTNCYQPKICFDNENQPNHKKCGCIPFQFQDQCPSNFQNLTEWNQKLQNIYQRIMRNYSKILDKFDEKIEEMQILKQGINLNAAQLQILKFLKKNRQQQQQVSSLLIYKASESKQNKNKNINSQQNCQKTQYIVSGYQFSKARQYIIHKKYEKSVSKELNLQKMKEKWRKSIKHQFCRFIQGNVFYQPEIIAKKKQDIMDLRKNSLQKLLDRIDWLQQDMSVTQEIALRKTLQLDPNFKKHENLLKVGKLMEKIYKGMNFIVQDSLNHKYLETIIYNESLKKYLIDLKKINSSQWNQNVFGLSVKMKNSQIVQLSFSNTLIRLISNLILDQDSFINFICQNFKNLQNINWGNFIYENIQEKKRKSLDYFVQNVQTKTKNRSFSQKSWIKLAQLKKMKQTVISLIDFQRQLEKMDIQQEENQRREQQVNERREQQNDQNQDSDNENLRQKRVIKLHKNIKKIKNQSIQKEKSQQEIKKENETYDYKWVNKMKNLKYLTIVAKQWPSLLIQQLKKNKKLKCLKASYLLKQNLKEFAQIFQQNHNFSSFEYSNCGSLNKKFLQYLSKEKKLKQLTIANIGNLNGKYIADMINLKCLTLRMVDGISEQEGCKGLSNLVRLEYLDVRKNEWVSDKFLESVGQNLLKLQYLNIQQNFVGDNGLLQLYRLSKLKMLLCGGTYVSGYGLIELTKFANSIRYLSIKGMIVNTSGNDMRNTNINNNRFRNNVQTREIIGRQRYTQQFKNNECTINEDELFKVSHNIRLQYLDIRGCKGIKLILLKLHRLKVVMIQQGLLDKSEYKVFEQKGLRIIQGELCFKVQYDKI